MKMSEMARRMIFTIIIVALVFIVISIIYYRSLNFLPFMFGVLLGSIASIIRVILLDRAVTKALEMEKRKAGNYVSIQHMLRLLLSGLVLVLGAIIPQVSLLGVVVGIFAYQLAIYNIRFISKRK